MRIKRSIHVHRALAGFPGIRSEFTKNGGHLSRIICFLPIMAGILALAAACSGKDDPAPEPVPPVILTDSVTGITLTTAVCGGTVVSDGGSPILARGVCWSLDAVPDISSRHTSDGTGTGPFTSLIDSLLPDRIYHARAYALTSRLTAYGPIVTFRTLRPVADTVRDIDGNKYPVIVIGTQAWLAENLRVTHYRTGDEIPSVTTDAQWKTLVTGALCRYDNLPSSGETYGNLYNGYAVSDPRGICPEGWHVPSADEWNALGSFLGGYAVAGGKMKATGTLEAGTGLWYAPNEGATNESGFGCLPGGYRINYGTFYSVGNVALFWSSSDSTAQNGWNYVLDANNDDLNRNFNLKTNGFSVRCIKD